MTTIQPMVRARVDGISSLATMGRIGQQSKMGDSTPLQSRRFVMLTDQHLFRPEGSVSEAKGQVTLQTSAEFVRTCNAQAHEIVDAIAAAVTNAQAGLNWLCAETPDLEEVRQALTGIASDGKRAAEIVVRLRGLMNEVAHSGRSS
jgi:hypothetical protein